MNFINSLIYITQIGIIKKYLNCDIQHVFIPYQNKQINLYDNFCLFHEKVFKDAKSSHIVKITYSIHNTHIQASHQIPFKMVKINHIFVFLSLNRSITYLLFFFFSFFLIRLTAFNRLRITYGSKKLCLKYHVLS